MAQPVPHPGDRGPSGRAPGSVPPALDPGLDADAGYDEAEEGRPLRRPRSRPRTFLLVGLGLLALWGAILAWLFLGMQRHEDRDPDAIRAAARDITDIAVLPEFQPKLLYEITTSLRAQPIVRWSYFATADGQNQLVIFQTGDLYHNPYEYSKVRQAVEQSLESKGVVFKSIVTEGRASTSRVIRNEGSAFLGQFGHDTLDRTPRLRIDALFPGKQDYYGKPAAVVMIFQGDPRKFTLERIVNMVQAAQ